MKSNKFRIKYSEYVSTHISRILFSWVSTRSTSQYRIFSPDFSLWYRSYSRSRRFGPQFHIYNLNRIRFGFTVAQFHCCKNFCSPDLGGQYCWRSRLSACRLVRLPVYALLLFIKPTICEHAYQTSVWLVIQKQLPMPPNMLFSWFANSFWEEWRGSRWC